MIQKQFFRVFQFFSPETGPRHEELPPPGELKSADPPPPPYTTSYSFFSPKVPPMGIATPPPFVGALPGGQTFLSEEHLKEFAQFIFI